MRIKRYWMAFLPPVLVLALLVYKTRFFVSVAALSPQLLVFSAVLFVVSTVYLWRRFVVKPAQEFLRSINRAIQGDFMARFSCEPKNANFIPLSKSFNQFMAIMENQTSELIQSRTMQSELYENEKIYRTALELTCERVFEADLTHNKFLYGLESYNRVFPFLQSEMYDEVLKTIAEHTVHKEDAEKFYSTLSRSNLMNTFTSGATKEINMEYRQKTSDREIQWMAATLILLCGHGENDLTVVGYVKNIDKRKRHELEIIQQSQKDGLTGIYNKSVTQSLIESFLADDGVKGNHAAVMLDIDDFKHINDTLGHIEGDYALAQVAARMQLLFQSTDILGRVGGDEFFLLIKNYGSKEALLEKLEKLSDACRQICLGRDGICTITGSIGAALYPQDGTSYRDLYRKADKALYHSKKHGKNRFSFYKNTLEEENAPQKIYSVRLSR